MKETGEWYFRRKARQDPFETDFSDAQEFIDFLHSREGIRWGAGAISRYVRPDQLGDAGVDLKSTFERIIDLFVPLMNAIWLPEGASTAADQANQAEITVDDDPQGDGIGPSLEKFMQTYGSIRQQPFKRDDGLWGLMTHLSDRLSELPVVQNRTNITVKWAVGQGNWARVPHISFLDQRETTTTQRGLYAVFLFREDLSGVYLTLNQGVTEFTKDHSHSEARKILRDRANRFGLLVPELAKSGFLIDSEIDLKTEGDLGLDYEASTIAYKLYSRGAVPLDAAISADLDQLLQCYDKLLSSKESARRSWIFQANPEYFDVDGAIAELDELSWLIRHAGSDTATPRPSPATLAASYTYRKSLYKRRPRLMSEILAEPQAPIVCQIIGSDRCAFGSLVVKHHAPVLAICRMLIEAGYDPERPLEAYRGETLCLKIRTIAEGAKLTIEEGPNGPRLVPFRKTAAAKRPARTRVALGCQACLLQIQHALKACRLQGAKLIIAKLDRLARNVAFISNLMESKVEFEAVDFPQANRLTIHIMAAIAEHEAKMISDRTRAALAAAKARGKRLGGFRGRAGTTADCAKARQAKSLAATARAADLAPVIDDIRTAGANSLRSIANQLNERGISAPRGGVWSGAQVRAAIPRMPT